MLKLFSWSFSFSIHRHFEFTIFKVRPLLVIFVVVVVVAAGAAAAIVWAQCCLGAVRSVVAVEARSRKKAQLNILYVE